MMVGGGLVGVGSTMWVDVDDRSHRNVKGMVEFVLDIMSSFVSGSHGHLGVD